MAKWLKWTLGIGGGLILALMIAIVVFILVFDWNWARAPITNTAMAATGREITIGDIRGEWSLRPRIAFEDVHFANAEWSKDAEMFSADRIEVTIDLAQLLRGRVVLPNIDLRKPKLVLERQSDGTSNWTFGAKEAAKAVAPENRFEVPLIGLLAVEDGTLIYRDPKSGLDLDGKISTVVGTGGEGKSQVRLEGKGAMKGEPFSLRAFGGSLLMLRESREPYPLTVELDAGPSQARISGTLEDPIKFEGLNLAVSLRGDNLGRIAQMTGVALPLTPPYDLKARLNREEDLWIFRNLSGTMGHSDLQGTLKLDDRGERPYIEADLTSENLDYRDVGSLIGIDPAKYEKFAEGRKSKERAVEERVKQRQSGGMADRGRANRASASPSANPEGDSPSADQPHLLPDSPLLVEQVRNTDAHVRFRGAKVMAPHVPLDGVALDLEMKDGVLQIKPLSLSVAGGKTIAEIKVDTTKELVQTDYDIKLQGYELERFLSAAGVKAAGHGKIYGRIRLSGPGDTIQKSLANANGSIRFVMYGGEISTLAMELIGIDVAEGLGLWAEGDKPAEIRCMAVDMPVESGTATTKFFVLDTSDTTVTMEGSADFTAEQLRFRILAHPKDPSPLAARTPITVTGPFAKPSVAVAAGPLAARMAGAVALGTLLTPLAAVLAFVEPGLEKDNDCAKLLQVAKPD